MRLHTHCARSLLFFWRTNLAVVLGAAVGAAALTGALIVGDSMRASLQEVAVGRLGRVDYALLAPRFFRAALAADLAASAEFTDRFDRVCPIIMLNGGATHAERRTRADRVSLLGVDDRFWAMNSSPSPSPGEGRGEGPSPSLSGRSVILNQSLADELGAAIGDDVLLRTGKPSPIATETLLGRRDDTVSTLRLTVAAIGDEAAVKWQLHLDLGKDLTVLDEGGRETRLRFVALLQRSVLQSELLVAEAQFVLLFPSITGQGFFLIDAPREQMADIERTLERALDRFSFDAARTSRRLAEFLAVQNTYLSTFQSLGGIGLLLGTAGLAVVLLRKLWERRGELSLMRTLGFSRVAIAGMVLSENAALLIAGLFSARFSAFVAIAPVIAAHPSGVPWCSLAATLAAVFLTGIAGGVAALVPAMRAPVLTALRAE